MLTAAAGDPERPLRSPEVGPGSPDPGHGGAQAPDRTLGSHRGPTHVGGCSPRAPPSRGRADGRVEVPASFWESTFHLLALPPGEPEVGVRPGLALLRRSRPRRAPCV